jgi:Ser/Thr protein kinase RdoA (MazF antagonist)
MKRPTNIKISLLNKIANFFNLGTVNHSEPVNRGLSNKSYVVTTSLGDYIFKLLVGQDNNSVITDIAIQKQLKLAGINTVTYLPNKVGQYIFKNNEFKSVVSRKINGETPKNSNLQLAKQLGEKLAQFHIHVRSIPFENNKALLNQRNSNVITDLYSKNLPSGIIHGDFHMENVLIDSKNQKILAVMDYEGAHKNIYLVDLGVLLMDAGVNSNNILSQNLLKEVIRGYEIYRELETNEKKFLLDAMIYAAKTWIKWFKANGYDKYAAKHQHRLNSLDKTSIDQLF